MSDVRALVVYYSRSGNTRTVARDIATALGGADIEEIKDTVDRRGWLGHLRSSRDAWKGRSTVLASPGRDIRKYDLVVIGTPVWRGSVSVPVRTYLVAHAGQFPRVAFFLTYDGFGRARTFAQMKRVSGTRPEAVLSIRAREIKHLRHFPDIARFSSALLSQSTPDPVHRA